MKIDNQNASDILDFLARKAGFSAAHVHIFHHAYAVLNFIQELKTSSSAIVRKMCTAFTPPDRKSLKNPVVVAVDVVAVEVDVQEKEACLKVLEKIFEISADGRDVFAWNGERDVVVLEKGSVLEQVLVEMELDIRGM